MSDPRIDPSRAIAVQALGLIKRLELRSDPHTYEVLFTYYAGTTPRLNSEVDAITARNGQLSQSDVDALYEQVFVPSQQLNDLDDAGARLAQALASAMSSIGETIGQTGEASSILAQASTSLDPSDPSTVKSFAQQLVEATSLIQTSNQALHSRLQASRREIETLQADLQAARESSMRDALTELLNRRYFDQVVVDAVNHRKAEPVSLLMIDIDHFKSFNDRFGHQVGDQVLKMVAGSLRAEVDAKHTVARYGGEEFAVVLSETDLEEAIGIAEQFRRSVMARDIRRRSTGEMLGRLTVSIGVSTLRLDDDLESWVGRADRALYCSKRTGRNRVITQENATNLEADIRFGNG